MWAGIGCGLLGGGSERALVLLAECIDGGVIVGGGGSAPLGSRLITDWLQAGTAPIKSKIGKFTQGIRFNVRYNRRLTQMTYCIIKQLRCPKIVILKNDARRCRL